MAALREPVKRRRLARARNAVLAALEQGEPIPAQFPDIALYGAWSDCRYCHLDHDWILVYRIEASRVILVREGPEDALFD